jgi:hypothetical protein
MSNQGAGAREIAVEVVDDEDELMVFVEAAVSGAEALMPRRRAQVRVPHSRARARGQEPFVAENSQLATEVAVAGNQKCRRRPTAAGTAAGGAGIGRRRPEQEAARVSPGRERGRIQASRRQGNNGGERAGAEPATSGGFGRQRRVGSRWRLGRIRGTSGGEVVFVSLRLCRERE